MLDVRNVGDDAVFRLVRIEPYLGAVQVVGEWLRSADPEHRWLLVDREGQVLLVSSSSSAAKHTVMRFEVTPFEDALPAHAELTVRQGHLAFKPIVDAGGYTFVVAGETLGVPRTASLSFSAASVGDDEVELE